MYEKDAEEYYYKKVFAETNPENETELKEKFLQTFQDGAEFGYNKANEWHWTKKEGFPKDNKAYLTLMSYGIRGTKYEVRENLKDEQPYNMVKWKEIE